VEGRVQGVFYRGWTQQAASALGLRGWVRNRADGSVEILASGSGEEVLMLIERCRAGPPAASVDHLVVDESEEEAPATFEIRPTV
jgi:acylphosphatase